MSSEKETKTINKDIPVNEVNIGQTLVKSGVILVLLGVFIFVAVFYPTLKQETLYLFRDKSSTDKEIVLLEADVEPQNDEIVPVDDSFSIIVPKIGANSKIIQDVDPYNSAEYQKSLTQGVAHAKGTALPGDIGNTFLFAHSSDNFYNANRYNSVFYLLNKVENDDKFYLVKDKELYEYSVSEKVIVDPDQVQYLTDTSGTEQATLMTCWPPGTTLQRLIIVGNLDSVSKL